MNKDVIIGIILSFLIHVVVLTSGYFRSDPPSPPPSAIQVEQVDLLPAIEMPPVETVGEPQGEPAKEAKDPLPDLPKLPELPSPTGPSEDITQDLRPVIHGDLDSSISTIPVVSPGAFGSFSEIYNPDQLERQPQVTFQERPQYPYEAKRRSEEGTVDVGFLVDTNGRVRDAYIIESSSPDFEESALRAIRNWRSSPG